MSNSSLVDYTKLSPNNSGKRDHAIDRITPHCVVGQLSVETIGSIFASPARDASCNYGLGSDGRVALIVDESERSWCSSSRSNDERAVTIECASDKTTPYTFNETVYAKLIELCVDICKRNGKKKLLWLGSKEETLSYEPKPDEMILTVHRWFKNKACPGDWMMDRMGDLAQKVTAKLSGKATPATGELYRVQVGAFSSKSNAIKYSEKLKASGFSTYVVFIAPYYKVQVGAFKNKDNATNLSRQLTAAGYNGFITTDAGSPVVNDSEIKAPVTPKATKKFVVGQKYKTTSDIHVRETPGGKAKSHSQLTADGKKHDKDRDGCLDEGTVITCQQISGEWVRCPSGWVSGKYLK